MNIYDENDTMADTNRGFLGVSNFQLSDVFNSSSPLKSMPNLSLNQLACQPDADMIVL